MKKLSIVMQPAKTKLCGQACVAILLGISLDEAIRIIKTKGATSLKHLLPAIKLGYDWYGQCERLSTITRMYSVYRQLPAIGLLRIRWNKKESHWVVKNGENILDPLFGVQNLYDFTDRMSQIGGRITSTFSLIDKTLTPQNP